jgi:hypothetical protein
VFEVTEQQACGALKCHFDPFVKLRVNSGRNLSGHAVEAGKVLENN